MNYCIAKWIFSLISLTNQILLTKKDGFYNESF
jgi:hypothetical protein